MEKVQQLILSLSQKLKDSELGDGTFKCHDEYFYIDNNLDLQLYYNLDPDFGNVGFQISTPDGDEDLYLGSDPKAAFSAIQKYSENLQNQ